jgi:arginyl-tRNA synthetase
VHVPYGLVNMREGKMSTRQGTFVYLDEALNRAHDLAAGIIREKNPDLAGADVAAEKVGMGAMVFADLSSRTRKDILFDWDEALNFNGETGPYVQYTYARLASILRKYGQPVTGAVDFSLLCDDASYALVKLLMAFPGKVQAAATQSEPSLVGTYVLDMCAAVNQFYSQNRVISDDEAATRARVLLVAGAGTVIKRCLWLLGMGALEEM